MRSSLEIFDLGTGQSRVVWQTDTLIEAPNWAPDGRLLVNGDGHLWWATEAGLSPVETGFADACNNDHGISPDGDRIVISHKEDGAIHDLHAAHGGRHAGEGDCTQPVPTGMASRPMAGRLPMSASAMAPLTIFTCPVDGGPERRLTRDMGHCDGPDYTPDGGWIWFNADGTGSAELWRMRPDGSGRQRMTDDDRVKLVPPSLALRPPHPLPCLPARHAGPSPATARSSCA